MSSNSLFVADLIPPARLYQVFIGGGDCDEAAFDGYLANPNDWSFVRTYANGYYVNNFVLLLKAVPGADAGLIPEKKVAQIAALFPSKIAFYETDLNNNNDGPILPDPRQDRAYKDRRRIDFLRLYFTNDVQYATLNTVYGDPVEVKDRLTNVLKWRWSGRPVLAMQGAYDIGGNINNNPGEGPGDSGQKAYSERCCIDMSQGSATDGPMGYWNYDTGSMQEGSYSMVNYSHSKGKIAMVMIAPFDPFAARAPVPIVVVISLYQETAWNS